MRRLRVGLSSFALIGLTLAGPPSSIPVAAAGPGAPIASVGSRIDAPLPPVGGSHGNPLGGGQSNSWRALDGKALDAAKAAADAAAPGLARTAGSKPSQKRGSLKVTKTVSGYTGFSGSFPVSVDCGSGGTYSGSIAYPTQTSVTFSGIPGGSSCRVTEGTLPGAPSGYTWGTPSYTGNPATIPAGGTVTVGITNSLIPPAPATLTLTKTVVNTGGGTALATAWTLSATGPTTISGSTGSAAVTNASVPAGTYTLAESGGPTGYSASTWGCTGGSLSGSSLTLAAGASATCSITNTYVPPGTGPTIGASWNGQSESDLAPPDPTGAMGPNSYIELINLRYGVYRRDGTKVDQGDLGTLTGMSVSELSDPQIVWDPSAQRFYYLVLDFARYSYAFGFSTTADPTSPADWCRYNVNAFYSNSLADYPKLAVTNDFVLVGANIFLLGSIYTGSDVDWFQKPAAAKGTATCPSSLGSGGIFSNLKNQAGNTQTQTPVPAVNADPSAVGWVVGTKANVGSGTGTYLSVYKVTNVGGSAVISAAMDIPLGTDPGPYAVPADAPQAGTGLLIDTMDTRLTHAVAAVDPSLGTTAVWTAHTVFGGAGAESRWYEIGVGSGNPTLAASGKVTDSSPTPTVFVWNGALAPDRANDGTAGMYGGDMVMGFNTSSTTTYSGIQVISRKQGSTTRIFGPASWVSVQQSTGSEQDFSCTGGPGANVCRWGDYGGASADPVASYRGQVWLSNEWNLPYSDGATPGTTPTWQTWNWVATP